MIIQKRTLLFLLLIVKKQLTFVSYACEASKPVAMNRLSWNCRGLGNSRTVRALHGLLKDHKSSFLFLIETTPFSTICFSVDRIGRSEGLAVLWKNPLQCRISGNSQHHIEVLFLENNNET